MGANISLVGITGGTTPTPPVLGGVTSTTANGTYGIGSVINATFTFSEAVTSSLGFVNVTFDTGGTCQFTVLNSTTASCSYTVGSGQTSSDLTTTSISGTIKNQAGIPMVNFTPTTNLAANSAIVIYTAAPIMSSPLPSTSQNCTPHRNPITISVTTNINSTCKYSATEFGATYDNMVLFMDGTGTTTHTKAIFPTCGVIHQYGVQCMDTYGNKTTIPATVTFPVTEQFWIRKHDVEIR